MEYKGYTAKIEYDESAEVFCGSVKNIRTVITFSGSSVDELKKAFKDSIDDYLKWCQEDGIEPDRP